MVATENIKLLTISHFHFNEFTQQFLKSSFWEGVLKLSNRVLIGQKSKPFQRTKICWHKLPWNFEFHPLFQFWDEELNAPNWEEFITISVQGKRCFCGVKYFAHQKEKQQHTNATQHEASSTAKARSHVFLFPFFFLLLGQTAGGLPTLECYRVWVVSNEIVWPQHLRPL